MNCLLKWRYRWEKDAYGWPLRGWFTRDAQWPGFWSGLQIYILVRRPTSDPQGDKSLWVNISESFSPRVVQTGLYHFKRLNLSRLHVWYSHVLLILFIRQVNCIQFLSTRESGFGSYKEVHGNKNTVDLAWMTRGSSEQPILCPKIGLGDGDS